MDISCNIIKDLLPLYAEDMVSDDSKKLVDDHLCGCEDCTKELAVIKNAPKVPVDVEIKSLKRIGDTIRRRRILTVMAVFLFIATLLLGSTLMLDATVYLSASEAVEDIYVEDNGVRIYWCNGITGTSALIDTDDPTNYAVTAYTNMHNKLFPSEIIPYDELDEDIKTFMTEEQYKLFDNSSFYELENADNTNFIYRDATDGSMTLILNADQPFPETPMMNVDSYTAYYVYGLVGICILVSLMGIYFRGKWIGELFWRLAIVAASLALSTMIVTAGQLSGLEGHFQEALVDGSVVALPMCLFGLCIHQLIKLNKG